MFLTKLTKKTVKRNSENKYINTFIKHTKIIFKTYMLTLRNRYGIHIWYKQIPNLCVTCVCAFLCACVCLHVCVLRSVLWNRFPFQTWDQWDRSTYWLLIIVLVALYILCDSLLASNTQHTIQASARWMKRKKKKKRKKENNKMRNKKTPPFPMEKAQSIAMGATEWAASLIYLRPPL